MPNTEFELISPDRLKETCQSDLRLFYDFRITQDIDFKLSPC